MTIFTYSTTTANCTKITIAYTLGRQGDVIGYLGLEEIYENPVYELNSNSKWYDVEWQRGNLGESFCLIEKLHNGEKKYIATQCNNYSDLDKDAKVAYFDRTFISINAKPYPYEIKALQMMGVSDEDISEAIFLDFHKDTTLDVELWKSKLEEAKIELDDFWNTDYTDSFNHFISSTNCLYYAEVSSVSMAAMFLKANAIVCKPKFIKYILGKSILPAQDGLRYMHTDRDVDNPATMWKTMFLLPSLKTYDNLCHAFVSPNLGDIHTKEEAFLAIDTLTEGENKFQFYEQIPQNRVIMEQAFDFLNSLDDEEKWSNDVIVRFGMAADYLELPLLKIQELPFQYLHMDNM